MKSTLRTPPNPPPGSSQNTTAAASMQKKKKHINPDHPHPDKFLHRLNIDIKSRWWHGMKLLLLPHAAPHHQRSGQRFYPAATEMAADFWNLFFYSAGLLPNASGGGGKKRSWKETAFFGSHNMNTAQHCPNTCSLHPSMDSWFLLASHQHRLYGLRYGIHHATVPQFNSFLWPLHQILTLWKNLNWYCCELWNSLKVN